MKTSLFLGSTLSLLLVGSVASAATHHLKATLAGTGAGTGTAVFTYDDAAGKLCGTITYTGLSGPVTGAHIHKQSGGVLIPFTEAPSPMPVNVTVEASSAADLLGGKAYVNLHTGDAPGGEIKGDVVHDSSGTDQCAAAGDGGTGGGTDAGSKPDSGSTGTGGNDGGSSGSSGGATTTRPDSGTTTTDTPSADDGGCSVAPGGSNAGNGLAIAVGLGLAVAAIARTKGTRKR